MPSRQSGGCGRRRQRTPLVKVSSCGSRGADKRMLLPWQACRVTTEAMRIILLATVLVAGFHGTASAEPPSSAPLSITVKPSRVDDGTEEAREREDRLPPANAAERLRLPAHLHRLWRGSANGRWCTFQSDRSAREPAGAFPDAAQADRSAVTQARRAGVESPRRFAGHAYSGELPILGSPRARAHRSVSVNPRDRALRGRPYRGLGRAPQGRARGADEACRGPGGAGDPPGFRLDDCATQRNLSAKGRADAAAVGARFRAEGVAVAKILELALVPLPGDREAPGLGVGGDRTGVQQRLCPARPA